MMEQIKVDDLIALQTIAETLNRSNDLEPMLNTVLKKLLEVTNLKTGWIFLIGESPNYSCVADHELPEALTYNNRLPMCQGDCWCLDRFWDGRLNEAVNIINCKRIEDAITYRWGDTEGITHHATVPLKAGDSMLGLLNVASPGKERFNEEELALLQAVAYQIGTAIARTKLYDRQQRRAQSFAELGEITRTMNRLLDSEEIAQEVVRLANFYWSWPLVALLLHDGNDLSIRAHNMKEQDTKHWEPFMDNPSGIVNLAFHERKTKKIGLVSAMNAPSLPYRSAVAVPLLYREKPYGVVFIGSERALAFDQVDVEVLEALSDHLSLALENVRLYTQRQELARYDERNRLARDLHDFVSQTLFSMNLTARGIHQLLQESSDPVRKEVEEISELSQHALREMRSLILQLRPAGLEDGLVTALEKYGRGLGLEITTQIHGVVDLARRIEETLWRIGQEALNNVRKHAGTDQVQIILNLTEMEVSLEVVDQGKGMASNKKWGKMGSFGLITMRERTEMVNGKFTMESQQGKGTHVKVTIPLQGANENHGN